MSVSFFSVFFFAVHSFFGSVLKNFHFCLQKRRHVFFLVQTVFSPMPISCIRILRKFSMTDF